MATKTEKDKTSKAKAAEEARAVKAKAAAEKKKGLRVIPLTMLAISLLKLIPDGRHAP